MKIAVIYPPIKKDGKYPLLSQNRQFRYSSSRNVRIFPLIPASAATILEKAGYGVLWLDGINERLDETEFFRRLYDFNPDFALVETKAPIIKRHWEFIDRIKKEKGIKSILVGDHVSFKPEESLENSKAEYVISGGDFDVTLLKLINHLYRGGQLPGGVYYRKQNRIVDSGKSELIDDLDNLPILNRELTKWNIYGEAYLYHPCAYILTGRGCGGGTNGPGRCSFCIWQQAFWKYTARLRSPDSVVKEIKILVEKYRVKEIFDDNESGAIWNKGWLKEFHTQMKKVDLVGKVYISSNARAENLDEETCELLKKTGFRLLKVGLESGSNKTLRKINKNQTIEQIIKGTKLAKDYGLIVMLTIMTGYPWESDEDVKKTFSAAKEILLYKTHLGDALQCSVIIPYPETALYNEAKINGWFIGNPDDYEQYTMSKNILKCSYNAMKWCEKLWSLHLHPLFLTKTIFSICRLDDVKLLLRGTNSLFGHEKDFKA